MMLLCFETQSMSDNCYESWLGVCALYKFDRILNDVPIDSAGLCVSMCTEWSNSDQATGCDKLTLSLLNLKVCMHKTI